MSETKTKMKTIQATERETAKIPVMRARGNGIWGSGYYQYAIMDDQFFIRFLSWTKGGHKLSKWACYEHLPDHVELKHDLGHYTTRAALARAKGAA